MDHMELENGINQARRPEPGRGFAVASLALGAAAFLCIFTMTLLPTIFLGCLSILFGILSRGNQRKPGNYALTGIIVSSCALVINFAMGALSFYTVFSNPEMTAQYWQMVDDTYEQMTGMGIEEILESYGVDPADLR
ncbi:MAG TPA: hypothetical protein H9763_04540 [Candidatus Eisenbergiella merdigallinarum]|uniref:DUF4190 domain-containing protein n=1 Tax=Candidatus Eisenbergiella merdigallinarum TaxID=2838552 RepID=A0A9D2MRM0_9FIRM|nr:hypothetical protein [Candidatus Eisenbergiella merdigallinarum]